MKIRIRHELSKQFKDKDFEARFLISEETLDNYTNGKLDAYIAKHRRQAVKDKAFFSVTQTTYKTITVSICYHDKEKDYWDRYRITILED